MQRILLGLGMIAVLGGLVAGGSGAFFSDTETSTGNTFTAGDIDLKIDNSSYALDFNIPTVETPTGAFVANPANSWSLKDLVPGVDHFFTFDDLKPGDYSEDTISIHVGSNNAWMCAAANLTDDSDQTCTEPELADDPTCTNPGLNGGELDNTLQFAFWKDDGDNVFEPVAGDNGGVAETIFLSGPLSNLDNAGQIKLADSTGSILGGTNPIPGDTTFYIGKMWCMGNMTAGSLVQDGSGNTINPTTAQGTGFSCDGSAVNNAAQTDKAVGDMQFYAVQSRNNPTFSCSNWTPVWPNQAQ